MASRYREILGRALFASLLVPVTVIISAGGSQARDVTRGRELYLRHCAGCHGEDGRGEAKTFRPNVGNLAVKELMDQTSDEYLFTVIQKGGAAVGKNPAMPAWSTQFRDDDIWDVVAFVRTLARR
jgi:mono/diheme cytochrome c family protein